ncbi:MAG: M55 family metallopeptidase [Armatimonadota bacterium]
MKLYIHTDIEGVAGMVHFERRDDDTQRNWDIAKRMHRLLTGEVNAAIEGAIAAGVDEVLVNDAHGSGYSIIFEELHPAARIIHGPLTRQPFWTPLLDESCDALFCIAQHAMAGTNGVLAHTCWCVNDSIWFGEGGMAMALAGYYGVPAVLITGDNVVTRQCLDLVPEMEAVAVKIALSPYNACSWTPARAREMIREGAQRAIERVSEIPPFRIEGPYRIGLVGGPGQIPASPVEGEDFRDTVYEVLRKGYDYDLCREDPWPLMPGRDGVFLTRGQRRALEQQQAQKTE